MRPDSPKAIPGHNPLWERHNLRDRQPITGESCRVRERERVPGDGQGLRLLRRRFGGSGCRRRVHTAADEPAYKMGRAGGPKEEARVAREARCAERGGARRYSGGVRIQWGAVHGLYHVDAPS